MVNWVNKEEHKGPVVQGFSSIKDVFENSHMRKIIHYSKAELAANFDITPTSIHSSVERFTGNVYDWSLLTDWPFQKIDLLTSALPNT